MDGLLIDSEDIYTTATNEVLHKYGRPSLPWSIKAQLQGRTGLEVCASSSRALAGPLYCLLMLELNRQFQPIYDSDVLTLIMLTTL